MILAYIFLLFEGITRFVLLYFASTNYDLYGELSYIFVLSVLIGSLVSFGSGQVILFERRKEDFCLSILLYLTIMALFFVAFLKIVLNFDNTEIGFFAFLYPTLSLLADGCRKSINILIRLQKTLFWICFLGLIFELSFTKFMMMSICLTNFFVYLHFVKNKSSNLYSLFQIFTSRINIKFFLSSVTNNASRFIERTVMLILLPSATAFGQFQALRDTCNLPIFFLGPLLSEKMLQDRGFEKILHLIIFGSFIGLVFQYFFLERLIPQEISLIIIIMICSSFDIGRVVSNVAAEINSLFSLTWILKFATTFSLLILYLANFTDFKQIFIFLSVTSLLYIFVIFLSLRKKLNA